MTKHREAFSQSSRSRFVFDEDDNLFRYADWRRYGWCIRETRRGAPGRGRHRRISLAPLSFVSSASLWWNPPRCPPWPLDLRQTAPVESEVQGLLLVPAGSFAIRTPVNLAR